MVSCDVKNDESTIPSFRKNGSLSDIWYPIRDIVSQKDFSIVYSEGGGSFIEQGVLTHKIFCLSNGVWEKIEIKKGIQAIDTLNSKVEAIEKNITLQKSCSTEDSQDFLNKLINLGLFELQTEEEIIVKCKEKGEQITITRDAGTTAFYLVYGEKVRVLTFYNLEQTIKDCPSVSEIDKIGKIKESFKETWFSNRHY